MEELKLLIEAIAGLPTITLWVLVGYLVYKLAVVGSIYGVIRFGIEKFVQWRTTPPPTVTQVVERTHKVNLAGSLVRAGTRIHATSTGALLIGYAMR